MRQIHRDGIPGSGAISISGHLAETADFVIAHVAPSLASLLASTYLGDL